MTREQASEVIAMTLDQIATQIMDAGEIDAETKQGLRLTVEAFTMARTALRSGWVRTEDRLPENDDNWVIGLWQLNDGRLIPDAVPSGTLIRLSKKAFPYWMPLPKLPEVEE
jgi:hypothetical protein